MTLSVETKRAREGARSSQISKGQSKRLLFDPKHARERAGREFEASSRMRGRLAGIGKIAQNTRDANAARVAEGRAPILPVPIHHAKEPCTVQRKPAENSLPAVCAIPESRCGKPLVPPAPSREMRRNQYRLLDKLRRISRKATRNCRKHRLSTEVQLLCDPEHEGRVIVGGVQTCHSVWGCPVCAQAIQTRRGLEIEHALRRWKGDAIDRIGPPGATAYMLTLTLRHHAGHELQRTFDVVVAAYKGFFAGRRGQRLHRELGIAHHVRSAELTWSSDNGWHPHLHAIVFTNGPLSDDQLQRLNDRWHESVAAAPDFQEGLAPNEEHGCKCRELWLESDGTYLQKMFQELTGLGKVPADGHYSYWQVAEQAGSGDRRMIGVWTRAQKVLFRRKQLTWSLGAKDAFGLRDLTDEMLEDPNGVKATQLAETLEIRIPGHVWDEGFRRDPFFLSNTLAAASAAIKSGDYSSLLALLSARLARQGGGSDCLRKTRDFCSALDRQASKPRSTVFNEAGARGAIARAAS